MVLLTHAQTGTGIVWRAPVRWAILNSALGVHVFFAISGFLITSILLKEHDRQGTLDLRRFYLRRVARIFPAFYAYVGFVAAMVAAGALAIPWLRVASAATFTWNYSHLWSPINLYAPPASALNADHLAHFWTLSIEEQFYLVWPSALVFLGIGRSGKAVLVAALAMPFLRFGTHLAFPSLREYECITMFHTASDPILFGVLAALWSDGKIRLPLARLVAWKPTGAVCLLVALVLVPALGERARPFLNYVTPFADGAAASLFLLWLLANRPRLASALEWRPLVWLGQLSYSLYLWQEPLTMLGPFHVPFPWNVPASVVVACGSYYLIENPARRALRRRWAL